MIEFDDRDLRAAMNSLGRAMSGAMRPFKREASKRLRAVMDPMAQRVRTRVLALPSKGHSGQSMRQQVARQVRPATRWSGDNTGVSLIQRARGMPRGFNFAGRMFNRPEGWNPVSPGGIQRVQQIRPAQWFDSEVVDSDDQLRRAVVAALEQTAREVASRARR